MIDAFREHAKELLDPVFNALQNGISDLGFFRLDPLDWAKCDNISIDYAVMEKLENIVVLPFSGGWSDVGSWSSVSEHMSADQKGVSVSNNALAINCERSVLRS